MSQGLLTIGDFAKLAETTKRTVQWYEEKGILMPKQKDLENGYRFYATDQIVDFKAILLLRRLNFSIEEIKSYLTKHNSPEMLFNLKKKSLKQDIVDLQTALKNTENYYQNIKKTGTLVNPKVKTVKSMIVYYIDKTGPYREIGDYFEELRAYFDRVPKETLGLVIYEDQGYQPKNAKVKVCLVIRPELKPNREIKKMVVPDFKALSYIHHGSSKLLSTLWQELKKYQIKKGYKLNKNLSFEDLELSKDEHITEMLLPIHQ